MNKRILRKFGFKNDQQGIINRYIRESGGWDKHLQNTKEFILQTAKQKNKKSCMVLGSGWLLDVPIDELAQLFDKVILVDIVHPKQIVHKLRKDKNIEFVEADITGLMEPIYYFLKRTNTTLSKIEAAYTGGWYNMLQETDFVVSVNILNQLDILICDYIEKNDVYTTEEIKAFREKVQQNHLDMLPEGKSCLISDYVELNLVGEEMVQRKPLVYIDLPTNKKTKKWQWNFDTYQTYHENCNTVFKVMGIDI